MATYTLSGTGIQAISTPGSLAVVVTVGSSTAQRGEANPDNLFHLGQLRIGNTHGYLPSVPIDAVNMLLPCINGATLLGYKLKSGVTITVEERAEQPYAGPTGPPGATGSAGTSFSNLIASSVLGANAASIDFSSIPNTYSHLYLVGKLRTSSAVATGSIRIRINGDTGGNYDWWYTEAVIGLGYAVTSSLAAVQLVLPRCPGSTATTSEALQFELNVDDYARTTWIKTVTGRAVSMSGTGAAAQFGITLNGHWRSTAVINQITFSDLVGGNMLSGSRVDLYGIQ